MSDQLDLADRMRLALPEAAAQMTQLVVDNPAQSALIVAGTIVATRAAVNIVKPRNALEALALLAVLDIGLPMLLMRAVSKGWIRIRIRDDEGNLVPLRPGLLDAGAH